jgi:hypothetical protein
MRDSRILAAVRLLVPLMICGATTIAAAESSKQLYRFEMVVFERPYDSGSEYWPDTPDTPDRQRAQAELRSTVPRSERELGPVAYTLGQRGVTVHAHLTWQQVPGRRNGDNWRWLDAGRVQGLVRVSRGRFLHLDTDLLLRGPGPDEAYRVRLNRRMRSNELHYLDHPKLGIVIQATRVDEAPAAPTEPADQNVGEPRPAAPS